MIVEAYAIKESKCYFNKQKSVFFLRKPLKHVGKMMKYLGADMEEKGRKKLQFSEKKRYRALNTEKKP